MPAGDDYFLGIGRSAARVRRWAPSRCGTLAAAVATALFGMFGVAPDADAAQPMRFERLAQEDGLSQNAVLGMVQDRQGFMWLATENGLNRYDGYGFQHHKRQPLDPGSLSSDFIWGVVEDPAGDLWIATDGGGLAKRRLASGSFKMFRHDAADPNSLASNTVRALAVDASGAIWAGHQRAGVDLVDPATGEVTHFRHDPADDATLSSDEVYAVHVARNGEIWIGTEAGLNRLNPSTGSVARYQNDPANAASIGHDRIRVIFEDAQGELWVGSKGGGLSRFDRRNDSFTNFVNDPADETSLSHDRVWSILEDDDGRLWIGTASGLNLMDRATGTFTRFQHDPSDPSSLGENNVRSLFQDRSGNLWVGTQLGGAYRWNPRSWSMGHVAADAEGGLSAGNVMAFAEGRDGRVWVGTFGGGLDVYDRTTGAVTPYVAADGQSLSDVRIMSLLAARDGAIWVGTMTGGVNRLDPRTGEIRSFRHDPADASSLAADGIMALFEDRDGSIWVGTFGGGVSRYDAASDSFTNFRHDAGDARSLSKDRATSFAQDAAGNIWIGTDGGGLNRLDPVTGAFERFQHDPTDPASLSANTVYALHVDAEGSIWVGTRGGGLDRVLVSRRNPGMVRFSNLSQADGLPNDVIYGIRSDNAGNLWISTNYGLSAYDPRSGEFKNFHRSHGLQAEEFNFGAHAATSDGLLFFGGTNGFNVFDPEALQRNEIAPTVALTSLELLNEPAELDSPYSLVESVELGYQDDVVTFEFAALDFTSPEANQYRYRLDGFDAGWVDAGNRNRVTYTNLAAGDYSFEVQAANGDGVWSSEELSIDVAVAPAPWATPLAYTVYGILGLLGLGLLHGAQRRKLQREAQRATELEARVERRTEQLAERNHELLSLNNQLAEASLTDPLTGLRNRRYLYEEAAKDVDLVRRRYEDAKRGVKKNMTTDLVFIMVDLDHFKPVNDNHGHAAGDSVLLQIRDTLRHACRSSDLIIRWGGDEFLVIARHTDADEAAELAERIRTRVADKVIVLDDGAVVRTTCSVGFACYPFLADDAGRLPWEQVMGVADRAMYMAKEYRNAWVGLMATEASANVPDLFEAIQHDTEQLEETGLLEIRSSQPRRLANSA